MMSWIEQIKRIEQRERNEERKRIEQEQIGDHRINWIEQEKSESFGSGFGYGFQHGRGHEQIERERIIELSRPFAGNPRELLAPTRCRVVKSFYVGGEVAKVDEIITLPKHDAESMAALRKVEIIEAT